MIETLTNLLITLNNIEVHGQPNLDRLLSCMYVIQNLIEEEKKKNG